MSDSNNSTTSTSTSTEKSDLVDTPESEVITTETSVESTPLSTEDTTSFDTPAVASETIVTTEEQTVVANKSDCCERKLAGRDMAWATVILRLWLATFCLTAGLTKFQTDNPAGGDQQIFDPNAWYGGTIEGRALKGIDNDELLLEKNAVWGAATEENQVVAKGWRLAEGQHQAGGPILNHPIWTSPDGSSFDLVDSYTKALPWIFIVIGIMVLLGITRRLAPALAAMICLSLAFGLWSMYSGAGSAETVLPLMPGFLPAVALVAMARFQKLCVLPRL